jgi:EAL domain-containing protein (putative c-di-GMP-specific phosphodiesterase class I)
MRLDHAMRQALVHDRLRLHYQPQVDLSSGRVVGAEALLRWRDPELGEVSPGEFIPVAEESGFIVAIGDWVLRRAVAQAAAWLAAGMPMPVSVNVSALQFQQPGFVDGVANALREAGLAPRWLELELTESILIQDAQDAMQRLGSLAELGVKLAIDDFGTGSSSLACLKQLPVDSLKIDRSFIDGLPDDPHDRSITEAIVTLGNRLGLTVVAEGVETVEQWIALDELGCTVGQGFLWSPPIPARAFAPLVTGLRRAARAAQGSATTT